MLSKFKSISCLSNIHLSEKSNNEVSMLIKNKSAKAYMHTSSFFFAILLVDSDFLSDKLIRYITLLLAAHPFIHDHAFQLSHSELCLGCYYDISLKNETLATELEKQLALTRYLKTRLLNFA